MDYNTHIERKGTRTQPSPELVMSVNTGRRLRWECTPALNRRLPTNGFPRGGVIRAGLSFGWQGLIQPEAKPNPFAQVGIGLESSRSNIDIAFHWFPGEIHFPNMRAL